MEIATWVLVGFLTVAGRGGPMVVENIATETACERLKEQIEKQIEAIGKEGGGFLSPQPKTRQAIKCHPVLKKVG